MGRLRLTHDDIDSLDASCQVTTLFIPGFDPQPVTANLLGTQGGLTSYVVAPGMSTVGLDDEDGFSDQVGYQARCSVELTSNSFT
ncbi:uncharacterized protein B0H18DRAFT_1034773, partial [Fomitopsis serialis]|uniref:uncharacterized protein n=1 Tax=Fomitopsis serialis TaxID=139415 RepID=UPI002008E02B